MCGENFYSCAKNLNIVFFLILLVFVYLIASRLLGRGYAIAAVTLTILSPIGESVSFFMPEMMYFSFISATIWLTLKAAQKHSWQWWLYVGLLLGFTSLVKPHALFALPVFVLFALFISKRSGALSWLKSAVNAVIVLAATLVIKFGVGFAFAGPVALTLFGTGYGGTVDQFVQNTGSAATVETTTRSGDTFSIFASTSAVQIVMHFAVMLLFWGIPFFLSLGVLKNVVVKKDQVSELGAFTSLIGGLALAFVVVVAVFEGFVTAMGDDHSQRIITRYYDFLIPMLIILAFALHKYMEPKTWVRWVQFGLIAASAIWIVIAFPTWITPKVADSPPLMGVLYQPWVVVLVAVIVLGSLAYWLFSPEKGAKFLSVAMIPVLVVVVGLAAQSSLLAKIGTQKAFFDVAGLTSKPFLENVDSSKIVVVGQVRAEVTTAKFWIDKAKIADVLVGEDGTIQNSALEGKEYALFLGSSDVPGLGSTVTSGDRFVLIKLAN